MPGVDKKFSLEDINDMNINLKDYWDEQIDLIKKELSRVPVIKNLRHLQYFLTKAFLPTEFNRRCDYGNEPSEEVLHLCKATIKVNGIEQKFNLDSLNTASELHLELDRIFSRHNTAATRMASIWNNDFIVQLQLEEKNFCVDLAEVLVNIQKHMTENPLITNEIITDLENLVYFLDNFECHNEKGNCDSFIKANIDSLRNQINFYREMMDSDEHNQIYFNDLSSAPIDQLFPIENEPSLNTSVTLLTDSERRITKDKNKTLNTLHALKTELTFVTRNF
jgi:hypothetical protein